MFQFHVALNANLLYSSKKQEKKKTIYFPFPECGPITTKSPLVTLGHHVNVNVCYLQNCDGITSKWPLLILQKLFQVAIPVLSSKFTLLNFKTSSVNPTIFFQLFSFSSISSKELSTLHKKILQSKVSISLFHIRQWKKVCSTSSILTNVQIKLSVS